MRTARFDSRHIEPLAREAVAAMALGPVLVPGLGGRIVLSRDRDGLFREFEDAYLLVSDPALVTGFPPSTEPGFRDRVRELLRAPLVARLAVETGWSGYGLAFEPLLRAIVELSPSPVGFGLPGNEPSPVRLAIEGPAGPGPTVVDFTTRPPRVDLKGGLAILEVEERLGTSVRLGPEPAFAVLVVCTGNACRSPMAAGILERLLSGERAWVESAGTGALFGAPATDHAVQAAAELGADITGHRGRPLEAALVRRADLVLVMEESHRRRVLSFDPGAGPKTRLLGDWLPGAAPGTEIPDPVGRPLDDYRRTAADLARACERVAAEVKERLA